LANHFGLISCIGAGMTDSKTMDVQAGFEKALSIATAALAGANHVAAYPGIVGSLLGQSFEGMIIDNDMLGNIMRVVRGIEVTDETLSYEVIKDVVYGEGHYLGHPQTHQLMKSEFLYPEISDRRNPGDWGDAGRESLYDQAHTRLQTMLADYYPIYIDPAIDAKIRDRFPIKLDPKDMRAGNGRW
jgi:trimethylamine--corrinoid protein Co-methyltransferase